MTGILSAKWELEVALFMDAAFAILVTARRDRYGDGWFGIMENPLVFCLVLVVPIMTHIWHILFGEGSISDYGAGDTTFAIFAIDRADWIITENFMKDGFGEIGLDGALLNTYEITTLVYMLVAYSLVHLSYKDSRYLVSPTNAFLDSSKPGLIFLASIFIFYSGILTLFGLHSPGVVTDIFFLIIGLDILLRVW